MFNITDLNITEVIPTITFILGILIGSAVGVFIYAALTEDDTTRGHPL